MKIRRNYGTVAFALAGTLLFFANTTAATAEPVTMEKIHSFFIGGERVQASASSTEPGGFNYKLDKHAYVDAFIPHREEGDQKKPPIVMMHSGISATIFLGAANGGEGAAMQFVRAGHDVYVVDPPGTGRAPRDKELSKVACLVDGEPEDCILFNRIGQGTSSSWRSWKNGPAFGQLGFNSETVPDRTPPIGEDPVFDTTAHDDPMNQMPCSADDHEDAIKCKGNDRDPDGANQFIGHRAVLTNSPSRVSIDDPIRDDAVKALLDHIGEPVIWMGWSRGGLLGMRLIVQQPKSFIAWAAFEGCQTSTPKQPVTGYTPAEFDAFTTEMTKPQGHLKGETIRFLHVNPDYGRDLGRGRGQYLPSAIRCVEGETGPPNTPDDDAQNNVSKYINDNGGHAETIYAPDKGVRGNGHNPMFQNNIAAYSQIYLDWFDDHVLNVLD